MRWLGCMLVLVLQLLLVLGVLLLQSVDDIGVEVELVEQVEVVLVLGRRLLVLHVPAVLLLL